MFSDVKKMDGTLSPGRRWIDMSAAKTSKKQALIYNCSQGKMWHLWASNIKEVLSKRTSDVLVRMCV